MYICGELRGYATTACLYDHNLILYVRALQIIHVLACIHDYATFVSICILYLLYCSKLFDHFSFGIGKFTIANISYFSGSRIWPEKILANDICFAKFAQPHQNSGLYGIYTYIRMCIYTQIINYLNRIRC